MTCPTEGLYQLEFEVKSIARCDRSDDAGHDVMVSVQFLNHPEQTVYEMPGNGTTRPTDNAGTDASAAATAAIRGKTFTFGMCGGGGGGGGGGGCPKPVRVTVRLYKQTAEGADGSRCGHRPEMMGSGELDVVPSNGGPVADGHRPPTTPYTAADEHTVPIKDGRGRSGPAPVAVLVVNARARCIGPVMAVPLEPSAAAHAPPPHCPVHNRRRGTDHHSASLDRAQPASHEPPNKNDGCCAAAPPHQQPHQQQPHQQQPHQQQPHQQQPQQQRPCRRACGNAGGSRCAAAATDVQQQRQPRHPPADHEACGGRPGQQRAARNNNDTTDMLAVQRKIASEAETFASRVLNIINEMGADFFGGAV